MNELSLFTGIGGGLLGTKLLGWRSIGYVEIDEYCQRVLEQRIKDGILDDAPIFGDIREFNRTYAKEFKGVCEIITAGFPCQPFSVAGKRKGSEDERNMWPATIECIRLVRPGYCLLENVPGLLTSGYFGTILGDLVESGYNIKRRCLSGMELGAKTERGRLFIVGRHRSLDVERLHIQKRAHPESKLWCRDSPDSLPNVKTSWLMDNGYGSRIHDDVSEIMEPIKAIGNAQIPIVVKTVWELLNED